VPRDIRPHIFFHKPVSPKAQSIPSGPFKIFSNIRGDIRTQGAPTVSLIPVANLSTVTLIPTVHLDLRISSQVFEKIQNDPIVIFRGLGEDDS
jgi:hypothetical protein